MESRGSFWIEMDALPGRWPTVVQCLWAVPDQAPLRRLGMWTDSAIWLCALKVITEIGLAPSEIRPMLALVFMRALKIEQERASALTKVCNLHNALKEIHNNAVEKTIRMRTNAGNMQSAGFKCCPLASWLETTLRYAVWIANDWRPD